MSKLKTLLNKYLSKEEISSLIFSYDEKFTHESKATLLQNFHYILGTKIYPILTNHEYNHLPYILGSGTQGFVVSIEGNDLKLGINKFKNQTDIPLFRIKTTDYTTLPKKLAIKIQMFDSKDKY